VGSMLIQSLRIGRIHEDGQLERYPFFYKWMDTDPTYIEKCSSCTLLPSCGGGCVVGRQVGKIPHF
jgi:radical SAM protein with 4Fe4S-binding SPASM domain